MFEEDYLNFGIKDHQKWLPIFDDLTFEMFPLKEKAFAAKPRYVAKYVIGGLFSDYNDPYRLQFSFEI